MEEKQGKNKKEAEPTASIFPKLYSVTRSGTLYNMLVRPILTYGSESWPLTRKDENMLRFFERKLLRRIYG
jgi:hypothetical protein